MTKQDHFPRAFRDTSPFDKIQPLVESDISHSSARHYVNARATASLGMRQKYMDKSLTDTLTAHVVRNIDMQMRRKSGRDVSK